MHTDTKGNEYYMLVNRTDNTTHRCMYVVSARHNKEQVIVNDDNLQAAMHTHQARNDWKEKVDAGWKRERNLTPKDIEEMKI